MRARTATRLVSFGAIALSVISIQGVEPWADQKLPVQAGLELWLDASAENRARANTNLPGQTSPVARVPNNGPLDVWHDASGKKRHLTQFAIEARPRLVQGIDTATVRFDGKDDFLLVTLKDLELSDYTLFIQATPRSNQGGFRAFLGASSAGRNDYTTGLNVDFGFAAGNRFNVLNVEGAGCAGFRNLLQADLGFNQSQTLTIVSSAQKGKVNLWVNGLAQGERERTAVPAALELLTVGARFYSNTGEPPHVQGFFDGDISQVLIYSRILTETERALVEHYLRSRSFASKELPGRRPTMLNFLTNPPPVRMFLPGFTWKELPVKLHNINCVKYREDGKLVALGYEGSIWLLSDRDGDGIEETAAAFWTRDTLRAPVGMALTPPNYARGRGVFIPSKGKVSLIVDTNRDDVADEELVVATGWQELPHGVDALGAALDREGNLYFGLGAANFTDPYLVGGRKGRAGYSLSSERGTILRVSADFSRREIVCTGIRFPVAMAFNAHGDLFCTDQEGATWLPNGNPLDELLHIQPGRHYGFPPRHPQHLPDVVDEPSVFDYAPQHQSTCGLNFNEPVNGGPVFGPASWEGDALVTGYSRGKLYRTSLVKTAAGYVARNQLIGSVDGLPADACVSPRGDLVIAVHSGTPDWGSGPTGPGKLYQVSFVESERAQPIAIWPASETETVIAFDGPLHADDLKQLQQRVRVSEGHYVAAGDRFEQHRPGYQIVVNQLAEPRFELSVHSLALATNGRTLAIRTARRNVAQGYAVSLPLSSQTIGAEGEFQDSIELACDLTGVAASWQPEGKTETEATWLPHLDLAVARHFTKGIDTSDRFWSALQKPGTLVLRTQLDLWQMLQPAVQPGSSLDYSYPEERVMLVLEGNAKLEVKADGATVEPIGEGRTQLTFRCQTNRWVPLEIRMHCPTGQAPELSASWFTSEDPRRRALPLRRMLLPWAAPAEAAPAVPAIAPELAGGNWLRGQKIFHGEQAACGKCHTVRGVGGKAGPDLSNLPHRDYASVMKDIRQPNAALNPDHLSYVIELKNGDDNITGVIAGDNQDEILIADASARSVPIPRKNIHSIKPAAISLMPEGLWEGLSEAQRKDLLTFLLLAEPLEPAPIEIPGAPEPRRVSELERILRAAPESTSTSNSPVHIVLCAGPKDHGPGEHDYPLWQKRWEKLFALAESVQVETAWQWPSEKQIQAANVIVFYSNNPGWSTNRAQELDAFLKRGGGLVYIHYAVDGHTECEALAERIGLAWRGGTSLFRHGPLDLRFQPHPITRNFDGLHLVDESYWNLIGSEQQIQLLADGLEGERPRPLIWVREQGPGRVFVSIPGHYNWTFDDPLFRCLLLRGIAWSAHQDVDRFNDLISIGARMNP